MASSTSVDYRDLADLTRLANDASWWRALGERIKASVRPAMWEAMQRGMAAGLESIGQKDIVELTAEQADSINRSLEIVLDAYQDEWWADLGQTRANRLRSLIQEAAELGMQPSWVAERLEASGLFDELSVDAIAITETTRLVGLGAQRTYRELGFQTWVWHTAMDDRVCPICSPLDGESFNIDQAFSPAHVSCLLPGQLVWGEFTASTIRRYEGPAVTIKATGGYQLAVTPNHPVLTTRGFVPAGALREGDHVVTNGSPIGDELGMPDNVSGPSTVEEVRESLLRTPRMDRRRMPVAAEDFHGDGSDGYVDVVGTDSHLRLAHNPGAGQLREKLQLACPHMVSALSISQGDSRLAVVRNNRTTNGIMRRSDLIGARIGSHLGPLQQLGRRSTAPWDASPFEPVSYRQSADAEMIGDSFLRPSLGIPGNDPIRIEAQHAIGDGMAAVLSVSHSSFSGPVYNFETPQGWYTSNGIVTHNCRCWPVAGVIPEALIG